MILAEQSRGKSDNAMGYIYLISNDVNERQYVGYTEDIERRWREHKNAAKNGDVVLYRAMRKYGIEHFHISILEECEIDKLPLREQFWIWELVTEAPHGYNMTLGGDGAAQKSPLVYGIWKRVMTSSEHRAKQSEIQKEYNAKHPGKGTKQGEKLKVVWAKLSPEQRSEIGEKANKSQTPKQRSERQKRAVATRRKNYTMDEISQQHSEGAMRAWRTKRERYSPEELFHQASKRTKQAAATYKEMYTLEEISQRHSEAARKAWVTRRANQNKEGATI